MYPMWLAFVLTLLSCIFLMVSAAPVSGGGTTPVKKLKQFQIRRPSGDNSIVARDDAIVNIAKRNNPPRPSPLSV